MADEVQNTPPHHSSGVVVPSLTEGQLTFGRYRLKKLLGRGGFGVVWLAYDEELQMDVALKFLSELLAADAEALSDLKRETRNSLRLTHSNIMRIYGFVQAGSMAGISMEYVDGDTLSGMKVARPERCFNVENLAPYVGQLCDALDYAHLKAQVVHRDLKPANLMINARNELKIADFGISRSISDTHTRMTDFTSSSGTPAFMSPQQMMGESPSGLDDIYSMGASLYDLLSGKPPFYTGDIVQQVWRSVPPPIAERRKVLGIEAPPVPREWEEVIAACLAKESADRPRTAGEVAQFLGLRIPSTPSLSEYTPIRLGRPPARKRSTGRIVRDWVLLGAALVGLIVTGLYARPPVARVEPTALEFGPVPLGEGVNKTFTITNSGGQNLKGEVVAPCPDFFVVSGGGTYSLKGNESLQVTIRFTPQEAGRTRCSVTLGPGAKTFVTCAGTGEDGGEEGTAGSLGAAVRSGASGTPAGAGSPSSTSSMGAGGMPGVRAGVVIEPPHLDFGTAPAGTETKPLAFTITNSGTEPVSGRVAIDCADFGLKSGGGGFTLKPGRTREVKVRFRPTAAGPRTCSVETGLGRVILAGTGQPAGEGAAAEEGVAEALTRQDLVQIRTLVEKYESALEALNAAALAGLWAAGRGPGQASLADQFSRYKSQDVRVALGDIRREAADAAVAPISIRTRATLTDATTRDSSFKGTIRFTRTREGRWLIDALRQS